MRVFLTNVLICGGQTKRRLPTLHGSVINQMSNFFRFPKEKLKGPSLDYFADTKHHNGKPLMCIRGQRGSMRRY